MSAPRTLGELRAAVARVLVARGEAADALRVDGTPDADGYGVRLWSSEYPAHDLRMTTWAATEGEACARAWEALRSYLHGEVADARRNVEAMVRAVADAHERLDVAQRAWVAAREAGE